MIIETENLKLIPCDTEILKSAIQGNAFISEKLNVTVHENWTEFGVGALQYSLDRLLESEDEKKLVDIFSDSQARQYFIR